MVDPVGQLVDQGVWMAHLHGDGGFAGVPAQAADAFGDVLVGVLGQLAEWLVLTCEQDPEAVGAQRRAQVVGFGGARHALEDQGRQVDPVGIDLLRALDPDAEDIESIRVARIGREILGTDEWEQSEGKESVSVHGARTGRIRASQSGPRSCGSVNNGQTPDER